MCVLWCQAKRRKGQRLFRPRYIGASLLAWQRPCMDMMLHFALQLASCLPVRCCAWAWPAEDGPHHPAALAKSSCEGLMQVLTRR
mmetsp:Transcript_101968/g.287833  ORF Transcript_101968/g.287833 Transcript_101968/m.287833 type:complete len:85 (+) Transcript_101968:147-401(+)